MLIDLIMIKTFVFWLLVLIFLVSILLLMIAGSVHPAPNDSVFVLGILGIILCFVVGGIGVVLWDTTIEQHAKLYSGISYDDHVFQPISSLKDSSMLTGGGRFFLGIGSFSINDQPRYIFYKKLPDDYYTLDSVPTKGVLIKEDGGTNPGVEVRSHYTKEPDKFYAPWAGVVKNWTEDGATIMTGQETIIHVPVGTIIQEYKLDSEVK
jgi:hypothetical protein